MLNIQNIIKSINRALEPFFIKNVGGQFSLSSYKSPNIFRLYVKDNSSIAYNSYGNEGEEVNVIKWFNDYWLFIDITFQQNKSVIISLSVFQGEYDNPDKNHLFRAEWDDYNDGTNSHPQPHWHFLTNKSIENSVSNFSELIAEEKDTFSMLLSEEKEKTVDLANFHFAMNGDWNNTSIYIHPINDEIKLAKWFGGLLAYLKTELEYIDRSRKR